MINLPQALIHSLRNLEGYHEGSFMASHQQPAPVSIRLNPVKMNVSDHQAFLSSGGMGSDGPIPWTSHGVYLKQRPIFTLDPRFHGGAYYVQEASSMFLEHMLRQVLQEQRGLKVLDLCAAPGGKTTLLASMEHFDMVVANEIIRSRVNILYENVVKWGDPKILVSHDDPSRFAALPGFFDVLVVDAPCSGSGLFRKDPEAIREWSPEHVQHCAERQKRILADALPALKPGGVLIYSTCSYSIQEDEEIVDTLIKKFPLETVSVPFSDGWGVVQTASASGAKGYRFYPDQVRGEGFFIAALRLVDHVVADEGENKFRSKKAQRSIEAKRSLPATQVPDIWISQHDYIHCKAYDDSIMGFPGAWVDDHACLSSSLHLRKSGVRLGSWIKGTFVPDHELTLSYWLSADAPGVELDKQMALAFLRKQSPEKLMGSLGWQVVKHEGIALGLLKNIGNRWNNYYPASWRIQMS